MTLHALDNQVISASSDTESDSMFPSESNVRDNPVTDSDDSTDTVKKVSEVVASKLADKRGARNKPIPFKKTPRPSYQSPSPLHNLIQIILFLSS